MVMVRSYKFALAGLALLLALVAGRGAAASQTYSVTSIPLPAGWLNGDAVSINNSGQVAGFGQYGTTGQAPEAAFVGTTAGLTPVTLPAGWSASFAVGINAAGPVA